MLKSVDKADETVRRARQSADRLRKSALHSPGQTKPGKFETDAKMEDAFPSSKAQKKKEAGERRGDIVFKAGSCKEEVCGKMQDSGQTFARTVGGIEKRTDSG